MRHFSTLTNSEKRRIPSMIKEASDRILALAVPHCKEQDKLTYSDKNLQLIMPPQADTLKISTLRGLVDLIAKEYDDIAKDGDVFAHVVDSTTVELVSR